MKHIYQSTVHTPVLSKEAIAFLRVKDGGTYIDGTIGGAGFALEILKKLKKGTLVGLDIDPDVLAYSTDRLCAQGGLTLITRSNEEVHLKNAGLNVFLLNKNFSQIEEVAQEKKLNKVDGIVFDLGLSSFQIEASQKGFSFMRSEFLDMRMDPSQKITAADLLKNASQEELYGIFHFLGEEPLSRDITNAVICQRRLAPINNTAQLAQLVKTVYQKKYTEKSRRNPATKVFQALRIAVNNELQNLQKGLDGAAAILSLQGRIAVISFHSLEDRIVKNFLDREDFKEITDKPIVADMDEKQNNPRSRSAIMRIGEKV